MPATIRASGIMQKPSRPLRLGTRGSPLALAQAHMTVAALRARHGWDEGAVEIVVVQTSGDRIQDRALADIGGKALWTKGLDRALASGEIDFAVHSMKDVETIRPAEIRIAAMLPRADVRDRLVGADGFAALPERPVVGTSSPRSEERSVGKVCVRTCRSRWWHYNDQKQSRKVYEIVNIDRKYNNTE